MEKFFLFLSAIVLLSCSKDSGKLTSVIGKWKRVEVYINPGNRGYWQKANDNPPVTLELKSNGTLASNHNLYGTYASYRVSGDSIEFTNTQGQTRLHFYSFENERLVIRFVCREGCGDKFMQ